jgi:hypothetical protein
MHCVASFLALGQDLVQICLLLCLVALPFGHLLERCNVHAKRTLEVGRAQVQLLWSQHYHRAQRGGRGRAIHALEMRRYASGRQVWKVTVRSAMPQA